MSENANVVYGRLLESVHMTGYTMERACSELELLLEDDQWKTVGGGFDDINDFGRSISLSEFKVAVDRRKKLAKKFADLDASQRATAHVLGVDRATVQRDLGVKQDGASAPPKAVETHPDDTETPHTGAHAPPTPAAAHVSAKPEDMFKMAETKARKAEQATVRNAQRAEVAAKGASVPDSDKWNVYHDDMRTWTAPREYDWIITDPPYPKEFLPLWLDLARRSVEWLKDGGLLVAMSGQSYLNEIYAMLSEHLGYYWTAAYLTPGQPTPLRQVNVNTTWKPMLIFSKGKYTGKIFGDVFKSDANDKESHKWGQSESGMADVVSKLCLPGEWILDPFCGAGTTGIAALRHGCLFHGIETDEQNVNISKGRLSGNA